MIIGITGRIGSGKSYFTQELVKRGFAVYDCDREAKRIVEQNEEVRKAIIALLGEEAFLPSQVYNTQYVAQRVFAEPNLLEHLNSIIHPAVREDIVQRSGQSSERVFFIESAILYESGLDRLCDKVVVIDAPEELRIARVIARDYHNEPSSENINKVRARMRAQQHHTGDLLLINDQTTPVSELVDHVVSAWSLVPVYPC